MIRPGMPGLRDPHMSKGMGQLLGQVECPQVNKFEQSRWLQHGDLPL